MIHMSGMKPEKSKSIRATMDVTVLSASSMTRRETSQSVLTEQNRTESNHTEVNDVEYKRNAGRISETAKRAA